MLFLDPDGEIEIQWGGGGTEGDGATEEDLLSEPDQSDGAERPDAVTDGAEKGPDVIEEDAAADAEDEDAADAVELDPFLRGVAVSSFQAENGPGVVDTNTDWYAWATDPIEDMVSGDDPAEAPGLWNRYTLDGALDFLDGTCVNTYGFQEKFGLLSYEFDDSWNITITPRGSFSTYGCIE